jgi:hypothetical protein
MDRKNINGRAELTFDRLPRILLMLPSSLQKLKAVDGIIKQLCLAFLVRASDETACVPGRIFKVWANLGVATPTCTPICHSPYFPLLFCSVRMVLSSFTPVLRITLFDTS